MKTWTPKTTLIVAGVAVLGLWYVKSKAAEVVEAVDKNFNPTKDTNLANRGAQGLWNVFTDGQGTIGTDAYDFLHDENRWWN